VAGTVRQGRRHAAATSLDLVCCRLAGRTTCARPGGGIILLFTRQHTACLGNTCASDLASARHQAAEHTSAVALDPILQCCEGLPETGITDEATWAKLLGQDLLLKPTRDLSADLMMNVPGLTSLGGGSSAGSEEPEPQASSASSQQQPAAAQSAYAELFSAAYSEPGAAGGLVGIGQLRSITQRGS
jgi:hypothetical protein